LLIGMPHVWIVNVESVFGRPSAGLKSGQLHFQMAHAQVSSSCVVVRHVCLPSNPESEGRGPYQSSARLSIFASCGFSKAL
jgi:hypothetical protein